MPLSEQEHSNFCPECGSPHTECEGATSGGVCGVDPNQSAEPEKCRCGGDLNDYGACIANCPYDSDRQEPRMHCPECGRGANECAGAEEEKLGETPYECEFKTEASSKIKELIRLADLLDSQSEHKAASEIDEMIKSAMGEDDTNPMVQMTPPDDTMVDKTTVDTVTPDQEDTMTMPHQTLSLYEALGEFVKSPRRFPNARNLKKLLNESDGEKCKLSAKGLSNIIGHQFFTQADDFSSKVNYEKNSETIELPCRVLPEDESRLHVWYVTEDSPNFPNIYKYNVSPLSETITSVQNFEEETIDNKTIFDEDHDKTIPIEKSYVNQIISKCGTDEICAIQLLQELD